MTYEEWRATRRRVKRTDAKYKWMFEDWDIQSSEMYVYGLDPQNNQMGYIEISKCVHTDHGTDALIQFEMVSLVLENQDWWVIHSSLPWLEQKLYAYFKDMGNFDATPSEMRGRLLDVSREAMDAFWEVIAAEYDECKSGDLGPQATQDFEQSVFKVVTTWRDNNGGGQNVNK